MSVILVTKVFKCVVHVLACVNFVVLSLSVFDFENVRSCMLAILSEISWNKWSISLSIIISKSHSIDSNASNKWENFPANSQLSEVWNSENSLNTEPDTACHCQVLISLETVPEILESLSVLNGNIVREKGEGLVVRLVLIIVLESVFLYKVLLEPGSTRNFTHSAEISSRSNLIQHI